MEAKSVRLIEQPYYTDASGREPRYYQRVAINRATEWEQHRVVETVKRLKLNEHAALAEERRKVWAKVSFQITRYQQAKDRCRLADNIVAKEKAKDAAKQVYEMTRTTAELSAVAKWCVLFRNDPQLTRLVA